MAQYYADIERAFPRNRHGRLRLAPIPVTLTLILANLAIFATDYFILGTESLRNLNTRGSFVPILVWSGEWWRLVTHAFVHADGEHLTGNLLWLLIIGYFVEPAVGRFRFLLIYLATSVVTGLVALAIDPAPSCGASASICGLEGVVLALLWRTKGGWWRPEIIIPRWIWTIAVVRFFWVGSADPLIDDLAHLTGFLTGVWFGCCLPLREWAPRRVIRGLTARHAGLAATILIICLLASGAVWQPRWWYAQAEHAEEEGDWPAATQYLVRLESLAIPADYRDAFVLALAGGLYLDHGEDIRARALLEESAWAVADPIPYVWLAESQAFAEPYMEQEALSNFREALSFDHEHRPALVGLARLKLTAKDSTIYDPNSARNLAKQAVKATGGTVASELSLLAEAHFKCGNIIEAIRLQKKALRLNPGDRKEYELELAEMIAARDSVAALPNSNSLGT